MGLGAQADLAALGAMLLLVVGYDLLSLHRVHRASLWAAPLTLAASVLTMPIANTGWWQGLAEWLAGNVAPHA